MNTERLTFLFEQLTHRQLNQHERDELSVLWSAPQHEQLARQLLENWYGKAPSILQTVTAADEVFDRILMATNEDKPGKTKVRRLNTHWVRYAAAILLIICVGTIAYFWNTQKDTTVTANTQILADKSTDVMPGSDQAILTLSNGQQVVLNSQSEKLIKDGNLSIENNNGQLLYNHSEVAAINTMTTPKGGQYRLTLADGTKVWMNAASSITFPTAFAGKTREVSVKGEIYFEVTANKQKPFIVSTTEEKILVLGTSFNVNTYDNDHSTKTSLIEGSVKIDNTILRPGQAFVNDKVTVTNISQDIAWKNGEFNFDHLQVQQVMRQIARWYNIEVKYEGRIPDIEFRGNMGRNLTLTQVLESLELMGMRFILKDRLLIVNQKNN